MLNDDSNFDEYDANPDFWLADMFSIINQSSSMAPNPFFMANLENILYSFVPMSIQELHKIRESMTMHAATAPETHIPLETGAPESICSVIWLIRTSWAPLKRIQVPSNTTSLRFAVFPIYALHGVQVAVRINNMQGRLNTLKIFVHVCRLLLFRFF